MRHRHLALALVFGFVALWAATPARAQAVNGSFEAGLSGWTVVPAGAATLRTSATPEALFPSDGTQFAELVTANNGDAVAGYGPHAAGTGIGADQAFGTGDGVVSKLTTTAVRAAGVSCTVSIDWTFLQDEGDDQSTFNDFLSIDVLDDATGAFIGNLVFVDTGTLAGTPFYSNVPGAGFGDPRYVFSQDGAGEFLEVAPHGFKRAELDVGPFTTAGQILRIEIAVGNVDDDAVDCRALIDNLQVGGGLSTGGPAASAHGLRMLGNAHFTGSADAFDTGGDFLQGRYRTQLIPGETFALRAFSVGVGTGGGAGVSAGGRPWILLAGTPVDAAVDFGFGGFSLDLNGAITVLIDGIFPNAPADVLLGTLGWFPSYLSGTVPAGAQFGDLGLQGIVSDPSNPPFNLAVMPLTEITGPLDPQIPTGTTDIVDAGGMPLVVSGSDGNVDLSSLGFGQGFPFLGTNYSNATVSPSGIVTFGGGSSLFFDAVSFVGGLPAVAPLYDPLFGANPTSTEIRSRLDPSGNTVTISWVRLTSNIEPAANSFSLQLDTDGTITFFYGSLATPGGIVGISPGNLMIANPANLVTNLSQLGGMGWAPGAFMSTPPTGEIVETFFPALFPDAIDYNDLKTLGVNGPSRITFVPDAATGGFDVFIGTR